MHQQCITSFSLRESGQERQAAATMMPVSSTVPYTPLPSSDESLDKDEEVVFDFPLHRKSDVSRRREESNAASSPAEEVALAEAVKEAIADLHANSQLFSTDASVVTAIDTPSRVGPKLGQGGFCQVHEYISGEHQAGASAGAEAAEEILDDEPSSIEASIGGIVSPGKTDIVIKFVSCSGPADTKLEHVTIGTIDLIREAHFLSVLKHPNLICMHGAKKLLPSSSRDFFVVLERLDTILEEYMLNDAAADPAVEDYLSGFLLQRLKWGLEIAEVLAYLHSKRIVYRDLKLSNIGLNSDGVVKLFDLGLAKELKVNDKKGKEDKYKLSGKTGSFHTMPPEVSKGWAYNEKADVYSFGIILWELLTSQRAFSSDQGDVLTEEEYVQRVVNGNERPTLPEEEWSPELCDLLERCWSFFPNGRPTMAVVVHGMQCLLSQVREQMDSHEEIARRRRAAKRRQRIVIVVCLVSVTVLLLSWYLLTNSPE
jgi:serine/threonine protein kinase